MDIFTNSEIFTTSEAPVLTTTESTTTKLITELTIKTSTEVFTTTDPITTEKTTKALIPIIESKKDIILLAMAGTIILGLFLMCVVCICRRRRTKTRENLELFERLAASSSTTVFDKDQ